MTVQVSNEKAASVLAAMLGVAIVASGGCGGDASLVTQDRATCSASCADLVGCGLATAAEATACANRCADDPNVATRDDGALDPECADPDDPCDCLDHASLTFERGLALTAFPAARGADGSLARQCGEGTIDGLLVDAVLVGKGRWPLDVGGIAASRVVGFEPAPSALGATLGLELTCFEGTGDDAATCAGGAPTATVAPAAYVPGAPPGKRHIVVIIDQSGSTLGLVDAARGFREAPVGTFAVPGEFAELASDRAGIRVAMAGYVARRLAPTDELCVIGAAEAGLIVPNTEGAGIATDEILAGCLDGGDHDRWLLAAGVGQLASGGGGRAPLWSAVDAAWDVLLAHAAPGVTDQILVIDDGPDTCSGEELTSCEPTCVGAVGVDRILSRLEAAGEAKPRIDFIQLQAIGYPSRDPRQLAVACQSGGQYLFLDHPPGVSEGAIATLLAQLNDGVAAVTASWDGVWRFGIELPEVGNGAALPGGTPPGALYALRGELVLGAASELVRGEQRYPIGIVPVGGEAPATATWDRRLVFRKACGGAADCETGGEPAVSCLIACSAETLLCGADPGGAPKPDGASCADGICCQGVCSPSGTCCGDL